MERYIRVENEDGETVSIPAKVGLCSCCEGYGKVENSAFSNGFTSSEWAELDDESKENYMAGDYDVQCKACEGTGRVLVPNLERMTFTHKRILVNVRREQREVAAAARAVDAEMAAERAFGC
ncbi:hypothetical protein ACFFU8_09475 [Chromobacterium piscinae]|uniref:hypothetical protein n=1 Tax=Chromobacterium piscinae TaxID=686831 RepID=UPI001E49848D|nr:hypothetical protein [Chromobacterium piscinae]MCD5327865.1 hypothetical protein [Chromobacterium piscinae]